MMSKNSFWANMKENLKRRNWIAVLNLIAFLLTFPIGVSLWISSMSYEKVNMGEAAWIVEMMPEATEYFSINFAMTFLVCILAVISAIQGFSYLFKRQKLDMYMSVPVSKERRFIVIYVNGILNFMLPYAVSLILGMIISAANGIMSVEIIKCALYAYLAHVVYFLAAYNITIIAVMLTGNLVVSFCATAVLFVYEIVLKLVISALYGMFFRTYYEWGEEFRVLFSPIVWMIENAEECEHLAYYHEVVGVVHYIDVTGINLLKILAAAAIAGVIGYFLYAKRPAESCNKAIAFTKTKPVIKVALLVPFALAVGELFWAITNKGAMTVLGLCIGILLGHGLIEVIFEFDLKAVMKHLKSGAVGAAIVFLAFVVFRFDVFGYDTWVPKASKVESIAVSVSDLYMEGYDPEKGYYLNAENYCLKQMYISDEAEIENAVNLFKIGTEKIAKLKERDAWQTEDRYFWASVKYRMKNGKEVYRSLMLPYGEETAEMVNTLVDSEAFKKGTYSILEEGLLERARIAQINFNNGFIIKTAKKEERELLLESYKEDLLSMKFADIAFEVPVCTMEVIFNYDAGNDSVESFSYFMPVYPSMERTTAYIEEHSYLADLKNNTDCIVKIEITHYNEETQEQESETFADKKEIEALLPAIMPHELERYQIFYTGTSASGDYDAFVLVEYMDGDTYISDQIHCFVDTSLLPDFAILGE